MLNNDLLDRISNIEWFGNCGSKGAVDIDVPLKYVDSWDDAKKYCMDDSWEDVTLEVSNQLSVYLHTHHNEQYQEWNAIVEDGKTYMAKCLDQDIRRLAALHGLGEEAIDNVQWDILGILLSDAYAFTEHGQTFYMDVLSVYESGHFPSGWIGEFPEGEMVVY